MKNIKKISIALGAIIATMVVAFVFVLLNKNTSNGATNILLAAEEQVEATGGLSADAAKAIGAAIVVGLAALGGTIAMGLAIAKSSEGISRQPEAEGKIRTSLMLGLVFIETVVIYALIVAILLIFVL